MTTTPTATPTTTPITAHNQSETSLNSFLKLGNWIYKYNTKISNIRLKIKYYKLILDNIDMELNEIENDYNNLNDCLKLINIEYDINKTSVLAYKKLIKNRLKKTRALYHNAMNKQSNDRALCGMNY